MTDTAASLAPAAFPLTRFLHQADLLELAPEMILCQAVDAVRGQHDLRIWEYSIALRAITLWQPTARAAAPDDPLRACDVGGASSRFIYALRQRIPIVGMIDPRASFPPRSMPFEVASMTVEEYAVAPHFQPYDIITAISVLEHVPNPESFLQACKTILQPGGLLVLTVDAWDSGEEDLAHFHWMRERIYTPGSLKDLRKSMLDLGYKPFSDVDWSVGEMPLYGCYSFASLVMRTPTKVELEAV